MKDIIKIIIVILFIIFLIKCYKKYLINKPKSIEGFNGGLYYYKNTFQNLVNKLKGDKKYAEGIENYHNTLDNIYKCLDYRYKIINQIIEKETTGRSNQSSNMQSKFENSTDEAPNLP